MIGLVWLAAGAGDLVSFLMGRRLGRPFLERHGPRLHLGPDRLARGRPLLRPSRRQGRAARPLHRHRASGFALPRRRLGPGPASLCSLEPRRCPALGGDLHAVGYGFSESFAESGESAARIALGAALVVALAFAAAAVLGAALRRPAPRAASRATRSAASAQRAPSAAPTSAARDDVEREVHAQVDARERHGGGDARAPTAAGAGRGSRSAVAAAKAVALCPEGNDGLSGSAVERSETRVGHRRARRRSKTSFRACATSEAAPVATAAATKASGRRRRHRSEQSPSPTSSGPFTHQAESTTNRPVSQRMLEGWSSVHERAVEVEQRSHRPDHPEASRRRGCSWS